MQAAVFQVERETGFLNTAKYVCPAKCSFKANTLGGLLVGRVVVSSLCLARLLLSGQESALALLFWLLVDAKCTLSQCQCKTLGWVYPGNGAWLCRLPHLPKWLIPMKR